MHVHILGIGGTFMGGIAAIAKEMGYTVTGSDQKIYPPMSTQLEALGIELFEGYDPNHIKKIQPDVVIVGNALSRGNPVIEALLNARVPLVSGPQWLKKAVLYNRWVLAVAGTHGKTTTTSMLAWIFEKAGLNPGFLIGGVTSQFGVSARLGGGSYFILEADEYDTAFFDKRSKFVHYWPKTCVINNLEFDHADIFDNLADIQKQFHHLVRLIPENGLIIHPKANNIDEVLAKGCWSIREIIGLGEGDWQAINASLDNSSFDIAYQEQLLGRVNWSMLGKHNIYNALAALAAAHHAGIDPKVGIEALNQFDAPKRRLEYKGCANHIHIYDDFAHHPTAIRLTLEGLRAKVGKARIGILLDIRSNTMRMGYHQDTILPALKEAAMVAVFQSDDVSWQVEQLAKQREGVKVFCDKQSLINWFGGVAKTHDHWVIMSNGSFNQIAKDLLEQASRSAA